MLDKITLGKIKIIQGDITKTDVAVIVNSAHLSLLAGSGVSGAIHQAAGKKLEQACKEIGGCEPGKAVLTPGFDLKATYIIHTVVPYAEKYGQLTPKDKELLVECYKNSIRLANEYRLKTVAFPSLGTGVRGFPLQETAELAVQTVFEYLDEFHPSAFDKVYFVMYSDDTYKVYQETLKRFLHKPSMNISIKTSAIADFSGDIIVIPCDSELTYKKACTVQEILEKGGPSLVKELSTVGYCEIGQTIITQGYNLKAKRVIFVPVYDHNAEAGTNYIGLHQSIRNAFILADLYGGKTIAFGNFKLPKKKKDVLKSLSDKFMGNEEPDPLESHEIEDIIIAVSKDFEKSSVKEVFIYK